MTAAAARQSKLLSDQQCGTSRRKLPVITHGRGRWRKLKGVTTVELADGTICEAEIHWYEAHGIGRRDFKIKRVRR